MPTGEMNWNLEPNMDCGGYPKKGSWIINYHMPSGKGKNSYKGTSRTAYLPNTDEGKRVLALLVKAFERRHTFIVGDSVTTG
jgi:deltex